MLILILEGTLRGIELKREDVCIVDQTLVHYVPV